MPSTRRPDTATDCRQRILRVLTHIQSHLDDCLPCLEAYDFEAELRMVIAKKCKDEVPETLRIRIAEVLRIEGTGGPGIPSL